MHYFAKIMFSQNKSLTLAKNMFRDINQYFYHNLKNKKKIANKLIEDKTSLKGRKNQFHGLEKKDKR